MESTVEEEGLDKTTDDDFMKVPEEDEGVEEVATEKKADDDDSTSPNQKDGASQSTVSASNKLAAGSLIKQALARQEKKTNDVSIKETEAPKEGKQLHVEFCESFAEAS